MEEMQLHNMSWIEVQFLKKAVDVLCQCRQTLMYTYVFAFYLRKNNQSIIFEVQTTHIGISSLHGSLQKFHGCQFLRLTVGLIINCGICSNGQYKYLFAC